MKEPFIPQNLPLTDEINPLDFMQLLIEANKKVAIYDNMLNQSKINKVLLLTPISLNEAVQSTRIEGTQVTIDQVLESQVDNDLSSEDVQEVMNYSQALYRGKMLLETLPISTRVIKTLHHQLLSGNVRGRHRSPGEFRTTQVFIGPEGCTIKNASFIPPEHTLINQCMSNLENYINDPTDNLDALARIAIIHAQFETIHPFLDGNGRIGRILIPLYLYQVGVIEEPNFFLSQTLEKDKYKYYQLLNDTRKGRWTEWITFFLECTIRQAELNIKLIEKINNLYDRDLEHMKKLITSSRIIDLLDAMFKSPIFNAKNISESTGININTIRRYLNTLEEHRIIYSDGKARNKKYYYYDLMNIIKGN